MNREELKELVLTMVDAEVVMNDETSVPSIKVELEFNMDDVTQIVMNTENMFDGVLIEVIKEKVTIAVDDKLESMG